MQNGKLSAIREGQEMKRFDELLIDLDNLLHLRRPAVADLRAKSHELAAMWDEHRTAVLSGNYSHPGSNGNMQQPMTDLQKRARAAIDAAKAEEEAAHKDLMQRVAAAAERNRLAREAREQATADAQAQALADAQRRRAEHNDNLLRSRALAGWQGTPAEFEQAWPDLRRRLLEENVVNTVLSARTSIKL